MKGLPRHELYKDSGVSWIEEIPFSWRTERAKWLFQRMERPIRLEDEVVTAFRNGQVTLRKNRREEGFTNALQEHGYQGIRKRGPSHPCDGCLCRRHRRLGFRWKVNSILFSVYSSWQILCQQLLLRIFASLYVAEWIHSGVSKRYSRTLD